MQRSTLIFVLLALFASVALAAKYEINVDVKKPKPQESIPESEVDEEQSIEEEPINEEEKPSPIVKKPSKQIIKEILKPKPGNKGEKPVEIAEPEPEDDDTITNKIIDKVEKIFPNPPKRGEKPEEPIKLEPDVADSGLDLPKPQLGPAAAKKNRT